MLAKQKLGCSMHGLGIKVDGQPPDLAAVERRGLRRLRMRNR